jgi:two-component system, cell cycle response regulator
MSGRVLVVDDTLPNVKLLEAKLATEYYEVLTATSGTEALLKAEGESPDIILLDVMMPGMDGYQVCQRLKQNPRTAHIPVVMVTALSDSADRVRGLDAGADEFLTKPVRDLPLFARVRSLIRLKTLMDAWHIREHASTELGLLDNRLSDGSEIQGATIAFLAEDKLVANSFRQILEKDQHQLEHFDTIDSLRHALQTRSFDLALSQLFINGQDILRPMAALRNDDRTRHTPVLLVAEEEDEPLLVKALEIGINDYILRPVDNHELRARVRTLMRRMRYQERLRNTYRRSIDLALTDELTQLYNRRYFNSHIDGLLQQSEDQHKSISLLMIDIDHFKSINDTHGHDEGDKVLIEVAQRIKRHVRECDLVARLGGEEFVVVMPDTRTGVGLQVAERLRQSIENRAIDLVCGKSLKVTVSVGLTSTRDQTRITRPQLVKAADDALYKAKRSGRNRVVVGELDELVVAG